MAVLNRLLQRGWGLLCTIGSDITAKAQWTYHGAGSRELVRAVFTDGTAAAVIYRLMQASNHAGIAPLEMFFNKLNVVSQGCIIGRGAELGPGLVLIHSHGVVINGAVEAGANLRIEHQVTIGAEKGKSPRLGRDVFVGCGAKILGSVTIGDGARIGANAVVVHDVPPNSTVVGVPARQVARATPVEGGLRAAGASPAAASAIPVPAEPFDRNPPAAA